MGCVCVCVEPLGEERHRRSGLEARPADIALYMQWTAQQRMSRRIVAHLPRTCKCSDWLCAPAVMSGNSLD